MLGKNESSGTTTTLDFVSHSTMQTSRIGSRLGELVVARDLILLEGPLGSGKTLLTQGIAHGMGITDYVTSPSFTLINEYHPKDSGGRLPLYHLDLYRLGDAAKEAEAMGAEDYFQSDGVCVIEWADRATDILPEDHLLIRLNIVNDTKRGVFMLPRGDRYIELLREFKRRAFGV